MSSHKHRNFHKNHIGLVIFAMAIMFIGVNVVIFSSGAKLVKNSIQERIKTFYKDVMYVIQLFDEISSRDEQNKILDYLEKSAGFVDAVYILDKDDKTVSGYGGDTFDINKKIEYDPVSFSRLERDAGIKLDRDFFIIQDKDATSDAAFIIENGLNLSVVGRDGKSHDTEVVGIILENFIDSIKKENEIFISVPLWCGVPLKSGDKLLIRNTLNIFYNDILILYIFTIIVMIMAIPALFVFIIVIITAANQKRIVKILHSDPVTEGNSWQYFEQYSSKVLTSLRNKNKLYAIVDVTLLKYGSYCTFHGVKAGEELLKNIDDKLELLAKSQECSARYGKSTFALLLKCETKEGCEKRVNDLIVDLTENLGHNAVVFHSGIYFIEPNTNESGRVIRRKKRDIDEYYNLAAIARAAITDQNHSTVLTFDQKLRDEQVWIHKVEEKMQSALDNEEFKVYIQPKYNPSTEELSGAEALIRWINDEDGFISPGKFIPIFEQNGFITKIDDYMISHVAKLQSEWLAQGKKLVPISVNVSRAHFADSNLAEHICQLVDEYKVPHEYIEIELTESAFFDDKQALLNTVHKLQEMGFDISMDDFGAGYSSLNSLKDLPLNVLKLDAEFFRGENGEGRGEIVVSQAIRLAKELNMKIVAEGVEKKDQVDFLAAHDCDMIQGFYFAKPMPANEYETRLKNK